MKFTAAVAAPLHLTWSAGLVTVGVGFTAMVKEAGEPGQLLIVGVTVTVPVVAALVVLVTVKEAIFPVPLAAKPVRLLLVQL